MNDWKNGGPTETFVPRTACATSGYTVPQNTTTVIATNSRPVARNEDSRETTDPIRPLAPQLRQPPHDQRCRAATTISRVNPISSGPIVDSANAWTEEMTPERVRNVPKIAQRERGRAAATRSRPS